jgi:hypothetical protein
MKGKMQVFFFFSFLFLFIYLPLQMTDSWDKTLFDKELKSILETKLPVSASKISSLQQIATAHPQVSL